jgi:UDP-galactopyranose mutase
MKHDFLIVGAGFFGAAFARLATDAGHKCLVIDRLPHMAGAAHDSRQYDGTLVSHYGAHILHSNSNDVWNFLLRFGHIDPFINKPKVLSGNKVYSFPINMMTLHQLWGVVTPEEARRKLQEVRIPCDNPRNFEEWALSMIGRELYELFIYGYTKKQWHREPRELPSSIIQRLPIRLTYDENYFSCKHQGMPREGYTQMVKNMLDGIEVRLGVDFFSIYDWHDYAKHLVYTGPIDKFFKYEYGELEYNTLRFEHRVYKGDFQGNAVFNHVDLSVPYIRTVEHKHFSRQGAKHYGQPNEETTFVSYDYPVPFKDHPEPYYPIRDLRNSDLYAKYFDLKKNLPDVTFGGRLGEYKYLDIDQTIASAMQKWKRIGGTYAGGICSSST